MNIPAKDLPEFLYRVDSPTLSNAIEKLGLRDRRDGFIGGNVRCAFPDLGVMVARALTVTMTNTPGIVSGGSNYWLLWETLAAMNSPTVIAISDASGTPNRVAYAGEIMSTLAQRLGAVGMVTDGALRDVAEVHRLGFHYFMRYSVVSHANFEILDIGQPVVIDGGRIETGDVLHGDLNGIVIVPEVALPGLPDAIEEVRGREGGLLRVLRGDSFCLEDIRARPDYSEDTN
jgi:4-hydroxy-4-methyl-2-oxoglutarate aldolase